MATTAARTAMARAAKTGSWSRRMARTEARNEKGIAAIPASMAPEPSGARGWPQQNWLATQNPPKGRKATARASFAVMGILLVSLP